MLWGSRIRALASRFGPARPALGDIAFWTHWIRDVKTLLDVTNGFIGFYARTLYTCTCTSAKLEGTDSATVRFTEKAVG